MIRRIRMWLRQTSPPGGMIVVFVFCFLIVEAAFLLALHGPRPVPHELEGARVSRDGVLFGGVVLYGLFRVFAFHPVYRWDYYRWLAATPWKRGKPLPLGPPHLVVQDALFLLAAVAAMHDSPLQRQIALPLVFVMLHSVGVAVAMWVAKSRDSAYLLGFGFGLVAWLCWFSPLWALIAAAGVCLLSHLLMARSFNKFPWDFDDDPEIPLDGSTATLRWIEKINKMSMYSFGWPFDQLNTKRTDVLPARERITLSLLAGWLILAALWGASRDVQLTFGVFPLLFLTVSATAVRLQRYFTGIRSPLSLGGRLATGRLIIWSFDRAIVVPLSAVVLIPVTISVAAGHGSPPLVLAVGTTVVLLLLQLGGPDLQCWRLTCAARLCPPNYSNKKQELEEI